MHYLDIMIVRIYTNMYIFIYSVVSIQQSLKIELGNFIDLINSLLSRTISQVDPSTSGIA